jgi:ketosteroid isomerase-like protein
MLTLTTMLLALAGSSAAAQQPADIEAVKAASKAFYAALAVLDDGTAMEKVWAHTPYVTNMGPESKSMIVGWDTHHKKYWEDINKRFTQRGVSLVDAQVHANGNLAWEMGVEMVQAQLTDGTIRKVDWIVTNVYEKIDGRWLTVSHHVQPRPR